MNDKELLELAAKAAGIKATWDYGFEQFRNCTGAHPSMNFLSFPLWNPLTDDGDALRLAVKLDLFWENMELFDMHFDSRIPDKCEATRLAIVKAAAEIGKQQ